LCAATKKIPKLAAEREFSPPSRLIRLKKKIRRPILRRDRAVFSAQKNVLNRTAQNNFRHEFSVYLFSNVAPAGDTKQRHLSEEIMMFADNIRNANTENEIYRLLTSYVETVRVSEKARGRIPEPITRLPFNGISDVQSRFKQLIVELDKASKCLDNSSCLAIKEGMHTLGVALNRLQVLNGQFTRQAH
jgi:hypothetical protein